MWPSVFNSIRNRLCVSPLAIDVVQGGELFLVFTVGKRRACRASREILTICVKYANGLVDIL